MQAEALPGSRALIIGIQRSIVQPPYPYDVHKAATLTRGVSAVRLQRYITIAGGDTAQALRLVNDIARIERVVYGGRDLWSMFHEAIV